MLCKTWATKIKSKRELVNSVDVDPISSNDNNSTEVSTFKYRLQLIY